MQDSSLVKAAEQLSNKRLLPFLWEWPGLLESMDAPQARGMVEQFGIFGARMDEAALTWRMKFGELLLAIQKRKMWEDISDQPTWGEFLSEGLSSIHTKLSYRTACEAIELAKSEILKKLPYKDRSKMSLANAKTIAKVERADTKSGKKPRIDAKTISNAKTLTGKQFKRSLGVSTGATVQVWCPSAESAEQLERLMERLRGASADWLEALVELLDNDELHALTASGIDNRIMFIHAATLLDIDSAKAQGRKPPTPEPAGEPVEEARP